MRVVWVRLAAAITVGFLATVAAADDLSGPVSFVPWKVLVPGVEPPRAPLALYWIPASADDFKHSELLFSKPLTLFAAQCVAMNVIRADDNAMIAKLGVGGTLPAAVLVDSDGKQLGKVVNAGSALRVSAVERLVRDQLRAREADLGAQIDEARRKALAGDREAAIAAFKSVWELRCLAPREARTAQRELRKLGVQLAETQ